MKLRLTSFVLFIPVVLALSTAAAPADAATADRVVLSVSGSGGSAVFHVRATLYWSYPDDFPPNPGVRVEVRFYGMDGNVARPLAAWTYPRTPQGVLQEQFTVSAGNGSRWANEDADGFFRKNRDEIRVRIRIYDAAGTLRFVTPLSNQVRGYF